MTENGHPNLSERSPLLRNDQPAVNGTFNHSPSSSDSECSTPILAADLERVVSAAEDAGLPGPSIGGGGRGDANENGNGSASRGGSRPGGPPPNMKLLMPAISIGVYLCAVDQLLAVATYAKIGSDLNALNSTSWVATAFQPLSGKLSDIFGRKECLLASYFIFGLGCLGCGLARDMTQLIIARAVSGIGGGGMTSVVSILLTDLVPLRERGVWQGYINIVYAMGSATGAPIGGLLADSVGWRWSFIGQFPICLAAFAAVYFILKSPDMGHAHWREKLAKIDFLGAACLIAAVFSLLLALDYGSNNGWGQIFTIVSLALAPVLFIVFVLVEMKVASHPFAPGHIIFDRSLFACYAANFFGVGGQMPVAYYGMTVVEASLLFIPGSIAGVVASLGSGYIIKRTGRYYWLTVVSYATLLLSSLPLVLSTGILTDSVVGTTVGLALSSFGNGAGLTTTLVGLISNAAPEDAAVVIACSYLFRSLGLSIGVSVMSAVMQQALRTQLAAKLGDGDEALRIGERVRESLDYIGQLEPQLADVVRKSYRFGVAAVFMSNAIFLVFALVAAFYIREKRVTK
ncbi:multidrug resistance protein fnx1 [Pyricularia oryzae Y34]|uniref:Multidrug resistance protein fnx1 n=2 Tax=Pyricularia oryzae TaxID=318829 RepID=A0AA97PA77_PYRO3|nr:multidrug resistance protein fnx1 [Pyricularia oryzae Y34]